MCAQLCKNPAPSLAKGACRGATTCPAPPGPHLANHPTCPGGRAAGCPHQLPAAQRYLPRSPPRRTPVAAGLQPRHGPAALLAAPGTDASPAASGKGSLCPALPGAWLPWLCSAQQPCAQQPGLCFHSGAFPRASGHGEGMGGAKAGDVLARSRTLRPRVCKALNLAELCQGLAGGPEIS